MSFIPEIYLLVITWILATVWTLTQAWIDEEHISDGDYIEDHRSRGWSRVLVGLLVGVWNWKAGIIIACIFWTFFDVSLNKMRNLDFWYLGTVAGSDNYWKARKTLYKISKVIALILSLLMFVKF